MRRCSVIEKLQIVPGCLEDYKKLAHFHYRDSCHGPFAAIFAIKPVKALSTELVGVIVYTMPSTGAELRNIATGNAFAGFDNRTRLSLINKNIRCISRVIIEPRFRGLGLASRLVSETMPKMNVPIIEAMAVMGLVNPFFEKAGMKAFTANMPTRCVQLVEAFSMVGVEKEELIDSEGVQGKLAQLGQREAEFIELQIRHFLQSYGKRRYERAGLERTGFVLSKLTFRPVYYIWFNEDTGFRG
jgi:hypothetical protein